MLATRIDTTSVDFEKLDEVIHNEIPSGMKVHDSKVKEFALSDVDCLSRLNSSKDWIGRSLGSLGGGNHFIELDKGNDGSIYLVIHTGSRNLGKQISEIYQAEAIADCSFEDKRKKKINEAIIKLKEENRVRKIPSAIKEINDFYGGKTKLPLENKD